MTRRSFVLWLTAAIAVGARTSRADLDERKAARVKENLIYHLAQLTRWPASARKPGDPLKLALYGNVDPFLVHLIEERAQNKGSGPALTLIRVPAVGGDGEERKRALAQLKTAHLVYTSGSPNEALFKALWGGPVLTVGEGSDFALALGMVAFIIQGGRVRIEVNLERARNGGLDFSAQLLQHAKIVG